MPPKITFIVATVLAAAGIAVSVTVPETRCFLRLESNPCSNSMKDVELIVQTDSRQALEGVSVEFKSKGAPENAITDSNGYVKIKIPETDVQVTMRKNGFEPLNYTIDLRKDSFVTRTYKLNPTKSSTPPIPTPTPTPEAPPLALSISTKLEVECKNFGDPPKKYTELISVSNKVEEPQYRFLLWTGSTRSLVCKIEKNSGELSMAYALPDNSELNRIAAKVYIDGTLQKIFSLSRGEVLREKVDLRGASSYKLEFSIISPRDRNYHSGSVYILER